MSVKKSGKSGEFYDLRRSGLTILGGTVLKTSSAKDRAARLPKHKPKVISQALRDQSGLIRFLITLLVFAGRTQSNDFSWVGESHETEHIGQPLALAGATGTRLVKSLDRATYVRY